MTGYCPHETPGGPERCALCRLDALAQQEGAERLERYGHILTERRRGHLGIVGRPMPDWFRQMMKRTLSGDPAPSTPEQPTLDGEDDA